MVPFACPGSRAVMLTACGQSGGAKEEATLRLREIRLREQETPREQKLHRGQETEYKTELNVAITANPPTLDVHGVNSKTLEELVPISMSFVCMDNRSCRHH